MTKYASVRVNTHNRHRHSRIIKHTHERRKIKQHETALLLAILDFHMLNLTQQHVSENRFFHMSTSYTITMYIVPSLHPLFSIGALLRNQ